MKGYKIVTKENKGFYGDIEYTVGKTYQHDGKLKLCESGFHFGSNIPECLQYINGYNYNPEIHNVLEVTAIGKVDGIIGDKHVTDVIYIEKILSDEEIYKLCTGKFTLKYYIIYYKDGKRHRDDGPAIEYDNGDKEWWIDGKCHREEGPAIEDANGDKYWFVNGERHRNDGPAAIWHGDSHKEWFVNGKRHRNDGPAIECTNCGKEWWIDGKPHREDGPAYNANGTKKWLVDGKYHREDGPAIEFANGLKEWLVDGKYHREDGPAIEFANGDKNWWINGVEMSQDEFEIQYPNQKDNNNINKCEYPGCNIYVINSTKCSEHYNM